MKLYGGELWGGVIGVWAIAHMVLNKGTPISLKCHTSHIPDIPKAIRPARKRLTRTHTHTTCCKYSEHLTLDSKLMRSPDATPRQDIPLPSEFMGDQGEYPTLCSCRLLDSSRRFRIQSLCAHGNTRFGIAVSKIGTSV